MTCYDAISRADSKPAWCSGCGNYPILKAFNAALDEAGIDTRKLVLVSGIGQAAKLPHYADVPVNVFNGLHGRAIPAATGIKLANHSLQVIITSGDGDMYGEGGNHFIHAVRRNISLKCFVHNNQVYGLTKGQASPTSDPGFITKIQTGGVISLPLNPLALAIIEDAAFVARTATADPEHMRAMMVEAMRHEGGFVLLDILQPCVTFNKINTFRWYKERIRRIGDDHDATDRMAALELSMHWGDEIPIGVLFRSKRPSFESQLPTLKRGPLAEVYDTAPSAAE
jgi:2-oxoglutarate ferredoxin oxidoreductase subunit beta